MSKSKSSAELRREFGRWLREQRKLRGIRQKYVAAKAKITVTQLSRIENGRSSTRRDTVIDLAQIIGIDEREALRHFTPESFPQLPKELEDVPFSEFSKQELREIADFITFKLSQKREQQADAKGEPDNTQAALPDSSGDVQPYRVKNGRLISDADTEEKRHTNQKPADE